MTKLKLADLDVHAVKAFLCHLESQRANSIATRNYRLTALRSFFAHLVHHDLTRAAQYQQVLALPLKRMPTTPAAAQARPKSASAPKRMYAHSQQSLESRGDFNVHLRLPKTLARSGDAAIVSESIAVRLDVAAADRERALSRRFEPVFFIDGQFAFENEVGFVPMTWNFDPATLNEGEHYLTVNLRGYEGNFGIATVKILVKHRQAASR